MTLPHQTPPVQRRVQQTGRFSHQLAAAAEAAMAAFDDVGIAPSDRSDCYRLPGLAQQLCLLSY